MQEILYLHGFLSSPESQKAMQAREYFAEFHPEVKVHFPHLPDVPSKVSEQLLGYVEKNLKGVENGLRVIGSSMGGFLATWLVEKFGGKAVLINPAVKPFELLQDYLGSHINPYSKESFTLDEEDITFLRQLDTPAVTQPSRYRVMLQTGDETLNYKDAESKYQHSLLVIEEGGDHSFQGFENHLDEIARFLLASSE
ncbi:YqiA/YcfP family alpha/beta fold hydrolase [Alteromonas sp. ASW11-130]|uniref:YqiA/YcfP family alpha/beta fold hydrolase n=1 Tax=Alteromonas sp. ASW11-130 TaxID=3015775 RepID=UPI002241D4B0|nr:YqiA/YcfP family alpha/beta fold hydrolase [Alteromonas sp. ASW11-130]MCW8090544.1 esterase YqiA [Alteromonas sp. ASW11-130]